MSRIPGFVVGPAPQVYYVQQPLPYPQVVQNPVNTVYIPPAPPVVVGRPTQVLYANSVPNRSVVYVNRCQPGQLSVIGGRLGANIGCIVDSALAAPPPPQVTVYHQYNTPPQQTQAPFVQYPSTSPPAYSAHQQGFPDYSSKPSAKP